MCSFALLARNSTAMDCFRCAGGGVITNSPRTGAGVPLETRKALLGHANGDITTHYSAAELNELLDAV